MGITDENLSYLEEAVEAVSVATEIGKFEKMDVNETMKNSFFKPKRDSKRLMKKLQRPPTTKL